MCTVPWKKEKRAALTRRKRSLLTKEATRLECHGVGSVYENDSLKMAFQRYAFRVIPVRATDWSWKNKKKQKLKNRKKHVRHHARARLNVQMRRSLPVRDDKYFTLNSSKRRGGAFHGATFDDWTVKRKKVI